jgi:hypothetical protein
MIGEPASRCPECQQLYSRTHIELNASGSGFTLTLTNVPVEGCRHCMTDLMMSHYGDYSVDAVILAAINALETLAPVQEGELKYLTTHCRVCKGKIPNVPDENRATFKANAGIGRTREVLGVDYYGDAISCPKCGTRHPNLTPVIYHKIKDSIARSAALYLPK